MSERRELALAILNERKEWLAERRDVLERQFSIQERTVTEIANTKSENHALRNVLQELTMRIESMGLHIQALTHALTKENGTNG